MNAQELQRLMNATWSAAKEDRPSLLLCVSHPPYKGNWKRFWCKLFNHKWPFVAEQWQLNLFGQICDRCGETTGGTAPRALGGIDHVTYDWWRSPPGDNHASR